MLGCGSNDSLVGGLGSDTIEGGPQADRLYGVLLDESNAIYATDRDQADVLDGGTNNDTLYLGTDDHGTGGAGNDVFVGDTWVDPGDPAVVVDFTAGKDQLAIIHDSAATADVTVADAGGDAIISIDGQVVMQVIGAADTITADMVATIEQDLAS